MGKKRTNVDIFSEAVSKLAETGANDMAQQTAYLGLIALSTACIADSLERTSDHMTADPVKQAWDKYRKAQGEETHV